tara:strand:+ start:2312 stop:3355 length:1044 start_codon:yes stop_codon:yes gene_type:complete
MKKKKILVIGGNGYLGSALTERLKKKHYIKSYDTGYFEKCFLKKKDPFIRKRAEQVIEDEIKNYDVVILLAAFSNDPLNNLDPNIFYKSSEKFTIKIAKMCKKLEKRFIFPSSCSVYGYGKKVFNENSKLNPLTHYSKNKVYIEKKLIKLRSKTFNPIILRFSTVFGISNKMRFDIVINMFCGMAITSKKIFLNSNGQAWRPHIYIKDVINVFEYFAIKKNLGKKKLIFNIGKDSNNLKIIDVTEILKNKLKSLKVIFLKNSKNSKNIFNDKKINDGVDKRSYKVSFKKINKLEPSCKINYSVKRGISELIRDLNNLRLNKKIFISKKFYRLQMYEKLFKMGKYKPI